MGGRTVGTATGSIQLTTGTSETSAGWSQFGVRPTSSSPRPRAKTISVADGSRETIRMGGIVPPMARARQRRAASASGRGRRVACRGCPAPRPCPVSPHPDRRSLHPRARPRRSIAATAVVVGGVWKRFGTTDVVRDLSFEVHRGELLGFLGPNGAGKTTTMRMILDIIRPDQGRDQGLRRAARGAASAAGRVPARGPGTVSGCAHHRDPHLLRCPARDVHICQPCPRTAAAGGGRPRRLDATRRGRSCPGACTRRRSSSRPS